MLRMFRFQIIYFLLEGRQFSSFHLLQSDELWHFYDGWKVLLYVINKDGELVTKKLGKDKDCQLQLTIEKHNWFAAELEDKKLFALFGCTVSPGFEFDDFELGNRNILIKKFPQHSVLIKRLTKSS